MKSHALFTALLLGAAVTLRADDAVPAGPLSLSQTLSIVLARYPSIDAAQAAIDAARGQTAQSASERLPQLTAGGSYTYLSFRPNIAFGGGAFYTSAQDSYSANITLSQLLTDFGHTDAIVAAAKAGELSAKDALEETQHQLGYQTIQGFYSVLLLRRSVAVADEDITSLDEALRIVQKKANAGSATRFDVLTTQVRLANARNHRTDTIASLEKQEASLRQLLGLPAGAPVELTGEFGAVSAAPGLSDAVAEGIRNRPEMHLALDSESGARAKLEAADRDNRPTIAAHASGILADNSLPVLYTNRGYVSAGVSVSVPLWTSGRTEGDRLTARSDLRSAQSREKLLTQQIVDDVEIALADLRAAQARLENADTLVAQAEEALALAKTRYTNGVITNFELLDAQSSAHAAELTRLQAHYDCVLASYALARASGRAPSA